LAATVPTFAQTVTVTGSVHDQAGGALPGVSVELRRPGAQPLVAYTDTSGGFSLDAAPGHYQATFTLINFASFRRDLDVTTTAPAVHVDGVLHLSLNADVTVTGKRTFANLA